MDQAMMASGAMATPEDEVQGLMQEVADEHGLEMAGEIGAGPVATGPVGTTSEAVTQQDDLTERLARLRAATH